MQAIKLPDREREAHADNIAVSQYLCIGRFAPANPVFRPKTAPKMKRTKRLHQKRRGTFAAPLSKQDELWYETTTAAGLAAPLSEEALLFAIAGKTSSKFHVVWTKREKRVLIKEDVMFGKVCDLHAMCLVGVHGCDLSHTCAVSARSKLLPVPLSSALQQRILRSLHVHLQNHTSLAISMARAECSSIAACVAVVLPVST